MILNDFGVIWSEIVMINEESRGGGGGSGGNEGKISFIRKKTETFKINMFYVPDAIYALK